MVTDFVKELRRRLKDQRDGYVNALISSSDNHERNRGCIQAADRIAQEVDELFSLYNEGGLDE